ncbi:MAG: hypothetical protein ACK4UN_12975 [Limisphaerales bacterium]
MLSSISGSLAGGTFARNRGGSYVRSRTVPINPQSQDQTRARAVFGNISTGWAALSVAQKQLWADYAAAKAWQNRLGDSIELAAFNWFVRINSLLLTAGLAQVAVPPTNLVDLAVPDPETVTAGFADAEWVVLRSGSPALSGARSLLFVSPPASPGVRSVKRRFRLVNSMGYAAIAETYVPTVGSFLPAQSTQSQAYRVLTVTPDGRSSQVCVGLVDVI